MFITSSYVVDDEPCTMYNVHNILIKVKEQKLDNATTWHCHESWFMIMMLFFLHESVYFLIARSITVRNGEASNHQSAIHTKGEGQGWYREGTQSQEEWRCDSSLTRWSSGQVQGTMAAIHKKYENGQGLLVGPGWAGLCYVYWVYWSV